MTNKLTVRRIQVASAAQANKGLTTALPPEARPITARTLDVGSGGAGRRIVTHLKALDYLDGIRAAYLCLDSDHGDQFSTTLPDGALIELAGNEVCLFGGEEPRKRLADYPQLARQYRRMLRNIPVAHMVGRGAGQLRPLGIADYLLDIKLVHEAFMGAIEQFYPRSANRGLSMAGILADKAAEQLLDEPLKIVQVNSAVGGVGSAISIHSAYYLRHLLEKRGVTKMTFWGIDLGPCAFQGRGPHIQHNYAARMRELDKVYREGFRYTFINGEKVAYDRPPYDSLFQVDLPPAEWPDGENRNAQLSDAAMDAWLRQVALAVHQLSGEAMSNRMQSLLRNEEAPASANSDRVDMLSTFKAALISANLQALEQAVALNKSRVMLDALIERCNEL